MMTAVPKLRCWFASFATATLSLLGVDSLLGADRPHIVVIMADDMGYTDVGCYGSEIETPVIDRLAMNGLRFTQFYNTSRCCPTRAALLTGLYSHQAGIGLMTSDRGWEAYRGNLNDRCVTIAEALQPAGYRTYMSGKWHVTRHIAPNGDKSNWPRQRGFDHFYGTIIGAGSFFDPATLCRENTFITPENDPQYAPEIFYYTDAISDNAAMFVQEHFQSHERDPMFLYVAYTSAHWPMHAPEQEILKYKGAYDAGYEAIRQTRYQKAIELGVIDPNWPLSPPSVRWESETNRAWNLRCMEVYAAMVDRMDQGIGRILSEIESAGQLDNTMIIYLQDNGGCAEAFGRRDNSAQREDFDFAPFGPDDLQTKIWPPMQTRDGRWVRTGPNTNPGSEDTFVAYGTGWANVSNTPFRGYKHDPYEGGISTPLVVHWPRGISQDMVGSTIDTPSHLIDLLPTCLDAAGATYPAERKGMRILPPEGVSLIPTFKSAEVQRENPLCFEHHGNLALRDGRWKIVSMYQKDRPTRWELYDMQNDRTELKDLADVYPERLHQMVQQWHDWADRVGVQPWPIENRDAN